MHQYLFVPGKCLACAIDHFQIEMHPPCIRRKDMQTDLQRIAFMTFALVADTHFQRVKGALGLGAIGRVKADGIHERRHRLREGGRIGEIAHMAVVIHPVVAHMAAPDKGAHGARLAKRLRNSPTMPRRNSRTQTMNVAPRTIVTGKPVVAKTFCKPTRTPAPTIGPAIVPIPPSSTIRTTSPDICQDTSASVAN